METILVNLKNSYFLVPCSIILYVIMMKIDSKITGKEITQKQYIKNIIIIGLISVLIVYICSIPLKINEEILHGNPPF